MDDDRRDGHERIPFDERVWCEDSEVTLYVPALDASDGGLCVRTGRSFEEGRRVRVGVCAPEGDVVATARVAWSRPDRPTPTAGLSIESFQEGREVFLAMVARARSRHARVEDPAVFEPDSSDDSVDD